MSELQITKCPMTRKKGLIENAICGGMVIPGKTHAYCPHCSQFFEVIRGAIMKLKPVKKESIKFEIIIVEEYK